MGYTTYFNGSVKTDKPVDKETFDLLDGISKTRRMKRAELPKEFGIDGEFYFEFEDRGQISNPKKGSIVEYNHPPSTQPGLWCGWEMQGDYQTIEHDGNEKFYEYVEWMEYFVNYILAPRGYVCNGEIFWEGEKAGDLGDIRVKDNVVTSTEPTITY